MVKIISTQVFLIATVHFYWRINKQRKKWCRKGHSRRVGTKLAAEGVTYVCRDLSLWNQLSHLFSDASSKVPHIAVSLEDKRVEGGPFNHFM